MASTNEPCCGHDHVGGDELWLDADELVNMITAAVITAREMPPGATAEQLRAAVRMAAEQAERPHSPAAELPRLERR